MEWVEITARTVEEATHKALDQLGVVEGDAEIVVVEEPKTGLFGRVRGEARVRARIKPTGPRPKRTRRGGRPAAAARGQGRADGLSAPTVRSGRGPSGQVRTGTAVRRGPGRGHAQGAVVVAAQVAVRTVAPTVAPTVVPTVVQGRERVGTAAVAVREATGSPQREEESMAEGMTLEEQGAIGKTFLEGLTAAFGLPATVEVTVVDDETVQLAVDGDELGILVGPRGPRWLRSRRSPGPRCRQSAPRGPTGSWWTWPGTASAARRP